MSGLVCPLRSDEVNCDDHTWPRALLRATEGSLWLIRQAAWFFGTSSSLGGWGTLILSTCFFFLPWTKAVNEATCTWSGQLPPRNYKNPIYSCKVFLGGVPWDITEGSCAPGGEGGVCPSRGSRVGSSVSRGPWDPGRGACLGD